MDCALLQCTTRVYDCFQAGAFRPNEIFVLDVSSATSVQMDLL